jgi:YD repeat-containing protein
VIFNQYGYTSSDTFAYGKPEQETTTYTYSPDNLKLSQSDQLGRVTTYSYDVNANPTSVTWLSGTSNSITATAEYDSLFSQLISVTDPLGNTTLVNRDTYGNPTAVVDPLAGCGKMNDAT